MRRFKRVMALFLAVLVGCATGYGDVLAAFVADNSAYVSEEAVSTEGEEVETTEGYIEASGEEIVFEAESSQEEGTEEESEEIEVTETEVTETETTEPEAAAEVKEAMPGLFQVPIARVDDIEEESSEEALALEEVLQPGLVNYLVVQEPMVNTPGTQEIMVGIGDGTGKVESAVLTYQNEKTKAVYKAEASEVLDDFVMFTMEFKESSMAGTYQLTELAYTLNGITTTTTFAQMGMDVSFGVNEVADTNPDDVLLTDEELEVLSAMDATVITIDENSDAQSIEDALEEAECGALAASPISTFSLVQGASAKGMKSIVVVLDAGHGGYDGGAAANGIVEKNVNLKIAQYCRDELEQYAGVKVIMTRDSDVYLTLAERAQVAIDNKADVFVCLHNNSSTSSGPQGANVYYPNSNYNSSVADIGKNLASIIESKLTDLGLASGGIHIRNSENNTRYPDGSLADYYGVIKRCKENGIPGLIVEHAFVSNPSDAKNYLSTDDQLKRLGVADATGIAQYYGLKKGVGFMSILATGSNSLELTWKTASGVSGYQIYRSTESSSGFKKVATITSSKTSSWKDTGLKPGTLYYYKIRSYTKSGSETKYGSYSVVASGRTAAQASIASIKSKNSKNLVIKWNALENVTGYELSRSTSKKGTYTQVAAISANSQTSYTDSKVKAGKLYYYKIRAIGKEGTETVYGSWSDAVSGRTAKVPGNVQVSSKNSTTLRISWTPDENAAGYVIQRATASKGSYKKIGTVKKGDKGYYNDKNVTSGKKYYYKVQAYNYNGSTKGYSGYSKAVNGKTLKGTSITKVKSVSSKKQKITWKKVDKSSGYQIYQSTSQNGTYKKIKTIKSKKTTSYTVTGLTPGVKYYYKVRAINKVNGITGYSDFSTVRSAMVAKAVIKEATGITGTKVKISWDAVKNADSFVIYRSTSSAGTYQKIGTAEAGANSYTDSNLDMTQTYYYKLEIKLKGYKATGTSGKSKAVKGCPVSQTRIASVEPDDSGALVVKWNKVDDITGYEVYRSTEKDGTYTLLTTVEAAQDVDKADSASDSQTVSYTDQTAEQSTVYWYKIRLVNTYNGNTIYGSYSSPVEGCSQTAPSDDTKTPKA